MSLKTSFFNKTLFKADMKRFWWVGTVYLVVFMTVAVLTLVSNQHLDGYEIMNVIGGTFAGVLPAILFAYLNGSGAVSALHAFPLTRKAHYVTHLVAIYFLLLIPAIICYIMGGIYALGEPVFEMANAKYIECFIMQIIWITVCASGGIFGVMMTGNSIAALAFAAIFIGLPYYGEAVIKSFLNENIHGIWGMDLITLDNVCFDEINTYMIVMFVISVALFFVSWLLYKNRKLESNGDIIAFNFLKPIFMAGVSFFAGLIGYFYLYAMFDVNNIFLILPFGLLGIIISYMLAKKAFTLKGVYKPCLIYILATLAVFCIIKYDLTGFERRVPDVDEVASVNISDLTRNKDEYVRERWVDGVNYFYKEQLQAEDFEITDKEDIEKVIKLHTYLTSKKEKEYYSNEKLPIEYTLTNGRKLKRYYSISYIKDKEQLAPVYTIEQKIKEKYDFMVLNEKTLIQLNIRDTRLDKNKSVQRTEEYSRNGRETASTYANEDLTLFASYNSGDVNGQKLYDAICEDIKNIDYTSRVTDQSQTKIELIFKVPMIDKDGKNTDVTVTESYNIAIKSDFVKTIALLKEYGLYEAIIKPSDITKCEIRFGYRDDLVYEVTSDEDIAEIYNYLSDTKVVYGENDYQCIRATFHTDNDTYDISADGTTFEPLPDVIKMLVEKYMSESGKEIVR